MKNHQTMRLQCSLQTKQLEKNGRFAGYASVFDMLDSQQDIVLPGAFAKSLEARGPGGVKLLWQHQQHAPIGSVSAIFEDDRGLYIEGGLLLDIRQGREAYSLLKAGIVSGLSIGYAPTRYRYSPDSGARLLEEVDLLEVSLVTFPANEAAQVSVVKQAGQGPMAAFAEAVDRAMASLLS